MKERQIKIWPETVHYLPAVSPLQRLAGHENDIRLDFSECREITTTGLTVLLLRLLRLLHGGNQHRKWKTDDIADSKICKSILSLSFFHHLNSYCTNYSIFAQTNYCGPFNPIDNNFLSGRNAKSYPIICLDFTANPEERRIVIKSFKKDLFNYLIEIEKSYNIHTNQIVAILVELAKNSADHTTGDAFFGMDIIFNNDDIELHFVFGDLGSGINQHIQDHLPTNIISTRGKHWSLCESYRHALKTGYTSTPERSSNKGLGMSLILDGAKGINMSLSVFDAESRGVLSSLKSVTHEELRKHFIAFAKDRTFFYYGFVRSKRK